MTWEGAEIGSTEEFPSAQTARRRAKGRAQNESKLTAALIHDS